MSSPFTILPPPPPPPPPPPLTKSNLPMLYYGLIVIGTVATVLVLYNLIIIRWCADRRSQTLPGQNTIIEIAAAATRTNAGSGIVLLPSSFKYKKEIGIGSGGGGGDSNECAVCLSAFEEGEEIRKLPRCRHCFHAPCIDMWLYSHSDCPLCRTQVVSSSLRCHRHVASAAAEEGSREVLLGSTTVTVRELR